MGGSDRNNELGDYIADKWKSYGMKVRKKTYEVLLSVPKKPAVLQLLHLNGSIDYEPEMIEHAFFKEENHADRVPPFHAFSAAGDVMVRRFSVFYIFDQFFIWTSISDVQEIPLKHGQLNNKPSL